MEARRTQVDEGRWEGIQEGGRGYLKVRGIEEGGNGYLKVRGDRGRWEGK